MIGRRIAALACERRVSGRTRLSNELESSGCELARRSFEGRRERAVGGGGGGGGGDDVDNEAEPATKCASDRRIRGPTDVSGGEGLAATTFACSRSVLLAAAAATKSANDENGSGGGCGALLLLEPR